MISGTYNVKSQFFKTLLMLVVVFQAKLASRKGARKLIAVLQVLLYFFMKADISLARAVTTLVLVDVLHVEFAHRKFL